MIPYITKEDKKLMKEAEKWEYFDENEVCRLKENAPQKIKDFIEKMKKTYSMFG